jgi:hypothetical protein
MAKFYCLRFETPSTWRARSPHLYPPGTGWPDYTPRHWVPFSSPPTTLRTVVELFNRASSTKMEYTSQAQHKSSARAETKLLTPNVTCWDTWPLYVTCLRYWSLLNTKCDVLEYWRRRSVCNSGFFTTSLVVTTISFYNVLWPSDVASLSGPGSSALVVWSPLIWSSLICVGPSLDLLLSSACWSALCDLLLSVKIYPVM